MGIDWEGMLGVDGEDLQDAYDASIPDTEWDDYDEYADLRSNPNDVTKVGSNEIVVLNLRVSNRSVFEQLLSAGLKVDGYNHWYYPVDNPVDKSVYEQYEIHYFQIADRFYKSVERRIRKSKGELCKCSDYDYDHPSGENWYYYVGVLPVGVNDYLIGYKEILVGEAVKFGESLGFVHLYDDMYGILNGCDIDAILTAFDAKFPSNPPNFRGSRENITVTLDTDTINQVKYMINHWQDANIFKEFDTDNPFSSKGVPFGSASMGYYNVDNFSGLLMHIVSKFYEKFVRGDCDRCSTIAVDSPSSSAIFYSLDGFSKVAVDKLRNLGCEVSVYTTSWFDDDYDKQLLLVRHVMEHCGIWTEAMDEECAERVGYNVCCLPGSEAWGVLYDDDSLVCQGLCNADLVPTSRGWDDVIIPCIFRGCVYVDDAEFEGFQVEIDCRGHVVRKDDIITILREYGGDTIGDDVYLSETPYTFHEPCNDYDYCDY